MFVRNCTLSYTHAQFEQMLRYPVDPDIVSPGCMALCWSGGKTVVAVAACVPQIAS
jgi:hypothetical protein